MPPMPQPYRNVHVIIMTWEKTDLPDIWSEVVVLRHVFEKDYKFSVKSHEIPHKEPSRFVRKVLDQYERRFSGRDNLLIVYYGGHSGFHEMKLTLSPWGSQTALESGRIGPSLDWSVIHTKLETITSDVLVFLDCCESVTSVTHGTPESSKPIEIIAGSGYPDTSYGFAKTLANFLRGMAKESSFERCSLTAANVFNYLLIQSVTAKLGTPVHFLLPGNINKPSISLRPLGLEVSSAQRSSQSQQQGWGSDFSGPSRPNAGWGLE